MVLYSELIKHMNSHNSSLFSSPSSLFLSLEQLVGIGSSRVSSQLLLIACWPKMMKPTSWHIWQCLHHRFLHGAAVGGFQDGSNTYWIQGGVDIVTDIQGRVDIVTSATVGFLQMKELTKIFFDTF